MRTEIKRIPNKSRQST